MDGETRRLRAEAYENMLRQYRAEMENKIIGIMSGQKNCLYASHYYLENNWQAYCLYVQKKRSGGLRRYLDVQLRYLFDGELAKLPEALQNIFCRFMLRQDRSGSKAPAGTAADIIYHYFIKGLKQRAAAEELPRPVPRQLVEAAEMNMAEGVSSWMQLQPPLVFKDNPSLYDDYLRLAKKGLFTLDFKKLRCAIEDDMHANMDFYMDCADEAEREKLKAALWAKSAAGLSDKELEDIDADAGYGDMTPVIYGARRIIDRQIGADASGGYSSCGAGGAYYGASGRCDNFYDCYYDESDDYIVHREDGRDGSFLEKDFSGERDGFDPEWNAEDRGDLRDAYDDYKDDGGR